MEVNSVPSFRKMGYALIDLLAQELERADGPCETKVLEWTTPEKELEYWRSDFQSAAVDDPLYLFRNIILRSINMNMRGNVGHQIAVPYPITALTSALIGHLNNGMGVYEVGMAGNAMERIIIEDLAQKFGLPSDASGFVTSGGSLGNLTAVLTAKAKYLYENPYVATDNLAILVSEESHYSIERTATVLGLPKENIIKVPVDTDFKMRTDLLDIYLADAHDNGKKVFCIIGCACSTSTGSFDDLSIIAAFAKKEKIWFHVDAAHGGASIFSSKYEHLLDGIDQADSIILDFHKMMAVPSLSTAVIFRHSWYSNLTFTQNAKYLWDDQQSDEWYNSAKRTFECTKPMSIVHIYTILRTYGYDIYQHYIDYLYGLAKEFAELLTQKADFEVLIQPASNIVCFRYIACEEEDCSAVNRILQQQMVEDGRFYLVGTLAYGEYYLRVSLMNTRTTILDLQQLLSLIREKAKLVHR